MIIIKETTDDSRFAIATPCVCSPKLRLRIMYPRNEETIRATTAVAGVTEMLMSCRNMISLYARMWAYKEGKIKYKEDIVGGLENAPNAFIGMMRGANFGKLLVRVSEE